MKNADSLLTWISRKKTPFLLAGLALGASVLYLAPVRSAVWTTLMISDFLAGESASLFKFLSPTPATSRDTLAAPDGPLPFDLYNPSRGEPHAGLILVHGFAHKGNQDPRIREHAGRLARAGFAVMAPDLRDMKTYRLGFADARSLEACIAHLRRLPQVDSARVGLLAPSFAAGPALIALSRSPQPLRFALIVGGYCDLRETLRYTLTGAYGEPGDEQLRGPARNRRSRWKFLAGNLDHLPPSPSRSELGLFMERQMRNPRPPVEPRLARFTAGEQALVRFMANEDPQLFDSLYAAVPAPVRAWVDTLSLDHYLGANRTPLLLVHSTTDGKVPYTESLRLSRSLPRTTSSRLYIIDLLAHVDLSLRLDSLAALWNHTLPGLGRLWLLAYHLLGHAR